MAARIHLETTWLTRTEARVFWQYDHGDGAYGVPTVCDVSVEIEPADPSVGYFEPYWYADGDAPQDVLDLVAEAASLRGAP